MISCFQVQNGHVDYGSVITIKAIGVVNVRSIHSAILVCSAEKREHPLI